MGERGAHCPHTTAMESQRVAQWISPVIKGSFDVYAAGCRNVRLCSVPAATDGTIGPCPRPTAYGYFLRLAELCLGGWQHGRMPLGRPPAGTTSAERSRTAVVGAIAARASNRPDRAAFFEELRLDAHARSVTAALSARSRGSEKAFGEDPAERDWLWDAYEFDPAKLGVQMIVAWLPRPDGPEFRATQSELLSALRATRGVIGLLDCMDDTIIVTALTATVIEKQQLQARLRELCPSALWAEVRSSDARQPGRGWSFIAQAIAAQEGRLKGPAEDLASPSGGTEE